MHSLLIPEEHTISSTEVLSDSRDNDIRPTFRNGAFELERLPEDLLVVYKSDSLFIEVTLSIQTIVPSTYLCQQTSDATNFLRKSNYLHARRYMGIYLLDVVIISTTH